MRLSRDSLVPSGRAAADEQLSLPEPYLHWLPTPAVTQLQLIPGALRDQGQQQRRQATSRHSQGISSPSRPPSGHIITLGW